MNPAELYAGIIDSSDAAIFTLGLDRRIMTWNAAAERIFGWSATEMVGQTLDVIIPEPSRQKPDWITPKILAGERTGKIEVVRLRKDGSPVNIAALVSPLRNAADEIIGSSTIARDITEELLSRSALNEAKSRFGLVADNISQLVWIAHPDGAIYWYNKRWFEYTGTTLDTMQGFGWRAVHHPDHVDRVTAMYISNMAAGAEWEDTFPLRNTDGQYRWFLTRCVPSRGADGAILSWFGTNTDVTALRDAEQRINVLMMEVNHRSKNLLSVVQSLARRTAAAGEDFIPRLERRIGALSANQDVLVERNWSAVPLQELIAAQLKFLEQAAAQTQLSGPDVVIQPATAEALSMTLHELATNAEKFGAYSVPAGLVQLDWDVSGMGSDAEFVLRWTESGGPRVRQNGKPGFGSRLIREVPRGRLRGQVEIEFAPQGFRFTLRCPAENVLAPHD